MKKFKDLLVTENIEIRHIGGSFKVLKGEVIRIRVLKVGK